MRTDYLIAFRHHVEVHHNGEIEQLIDFLRTIQTLLVAANVEHPHMQCYMVLRRIDALKSLLMVVMERGGSKL